MTKTVRIENADTSPYKIAVDVVETRIFDGIETDVVVETKHLNNPTDLLPFTLCNGRKLVVREAD